MAFIHDLPGAARRHLEAADKLYQEPDKGHHRKDVAGYLYGIAAECAVKQMLIPLQLSRQHDKNAILYQHFPDLRTMLRDCLQGRNATSLMRFVKDDKFMNNWDITMRYADARQIRETWVDAWKEQAHAIVNAMGGT